MSADDSAPSGSSSGSLSSFANRRCVPRYPLIAEAEVLELSTETRLKARTSEIALKGCYLDMINPIPENSLVRIRISRDQGTFEAIGRVVYNQPGMGMGIMFTEIAPEHEKMLHEWIAGLGG